MNPNPCKPNRSTQISNSSSSKIDTKMLGKKKCKFNRKIKQSYINHDSLKKTPLSLKRFWEKTHERIFRSSIGKFPYINSFMRGVNRLGGEGIWQVMKCTSNDRNTHLLKRFSRKQSDCVLQMVQCMYIYLFQTLMHPSLKITRKKGWLFLELLVFIKQIIAGAVSVVVENKTC